MNGMFEIWISASMSRSGHTLTITPRLRALTLGTWFFVKIFIELFYLLYFLINNLFFDLNLLFDFFILSVDKLNIH